jgi:hypothetical protein
MSSGAFCGRAAAARMGLLGDPIGLPHAVKDMAVHRVAFRQVRAVEIVGLRSRHANTFHDSDRPAIGRDGEGNDFLQFERCESVPKHGGGCLAGVAATPVWLGQAPADFDTWREMRLEAGTAQADKPDERRNAGRFSRPKAVVSLGKRLSYARRQIVALLGRDNARKILHDPGIAVEGPKWPEIPVSPMPEHKAARGESWSGHWIVFKPGKSFWTASPLRPLSRGCKARPCDDVVLSAARGLPVIGTATSNQKRTR